MSSSRRRRAPERQPPEETIPNVIEEPDDFEAVEGDALDNDEPIPVEPVDSVTTPSVAQTTGAGENCEVLFNLKCLFEMAVVTQLKCICLKLYSVFNSFLFVHDFAGKNTSAEPVEKGPTSDAQTTGTGAAPVVILYN